jgi:hypothetical protein
MVFCKTRGRFSVISHLRASPINGMTEKRPLVLKKTSLITQYLQNEQSSLILTELAQCKKATTYEVGNARLGWNIHKHVAGLKRLMRSQFSRLVTSISTVNV